MAEPLPRRLRCIGLAASLGLAYELARHVQRRISLHQDGYAVTVQGDPHEVVAALRAGFRAGNVLVAQDNAVVARFSGEAGPFGFRTVELITFSPTEVSFEHLGGTFQACQESFVARAVGLGVTRLEHSGWFIMRGGLPGWLLGILLVRRLFERHVEEQMTRFAATRANTAG